MMQLSQGGLMLKIPIKPTRSGSSRPSSARAPSLAERKEIARLLDRAQGNVVLLRYDIPRAKTALTRAEKAHAKAKRDLERLYERRAKWEARVETHKAELREFDDCGN